MTMLATIAQVVAEAFVSGLWQGMVLVALVALVLRMVPRLGAGARFAIWAIAFAAAVVVPLVRFEGHATGQSAAGVRLGLGWAFAVVAVWASLAFLRLARLVTQGISLRRIWRDAEPVETGTEIAALLQEMPRRPVLCTSGAVDAPSVIGFWSPKLLIPDWQIGALAHGELRQIVLHECEHLRRRDDWINLLQKIALALFPLNPALLWADRRLSLERELACDAGVVERTRAPFDYAACLTRLAEQRIGRRSVALALSAWAGKSELGHRVVRLLQPIGTMRKMPRRVCVAALVTIVAGGSTELARMPRLISFADGSAVQIAAESPDNVEHVGPAAAGRMMPVIYREPVRMASAVTRIHVAAGKRGRRRNATVRDGSAWRNEAATERRTMVSPARARLMLTTAEADTRIEVLPAEPVRVRLVDAVQVEGSGSYTAVPFANGWLILQL